MGLLKKLKGELIDIIEYLDSTNNTMVHRFERYGNEIKNNAKLVVRESQKAVFVNEGTVADVFEPGTYTLSTQNLPILTTIKGWKYGFNSPFKAEVYFINTKNFIDMKWGTKNPVMMRDQDFGIVRIRAFGSYAFKVGNPVNFIKEIAGTDGQFETSEVEQQLKNIIVTRFTDYVGESKIPVLDLAANYDEFSDALQEKAKVEFDEYGLELTKFLIENISLPPEVEEAIDKRSSMGAIGNLNAYSQFQAANAMEDAAKNPGGEASAGIGMGMGFAMANQMGQTMMGGQQQQQQQAPQQQQAAPPPPIPPTISFFIAVNGAQTGPFNMTDLQAKMGSGELTKESLVWKQGMAQWLKAGEVAELAPLFPPPPPPPIPGS